MAKALEVSPAAIEEIRRLRREGYTLDFTQQGTTPCGMDFCRADDGTQGFIVYCDGACLNQRIDYFEELDRVLDERGIYALTIGETIAS